LLEATRTRTAMTPRAASRRSKAEVAANGGGDDVLPAVRDEDVSPVAAGASPPRLVQTNKTLNCCRPVFRYSRAGVFPLPELC